MRAEDFHDFVGFFIAAGGDIDAANNEGDRLRDILSRHRHSQPYLDALSQG